MHFESFRHPGSTRCKHQASAPIGAPLLALQGLAIERGSRRPFTELAFELRAGEMLWVRGQSGRGKTSLLRLAAPLQRGGSVLIAGQQAALDPALPRTGCIRWPLSL